MDRSSTLPHRRRVSCDTCCDVREVFRIIGGTKWRQACPDCAAGSW